MPWPLPPALMVDCVPLAESNSAAACLTRGCSADEPSAEIFWPESPETLGEVPFVDTVGARSDEETLQAVRVGFVVAVAPPVVDVVPQPAATKMRPRSAAKLT